MKQRRQNGIRAAPRYPGRHPDPGQGLTTSVSGPRPRMAISRPRRKRDLKSSTHRERSKSHELDGLFEHPLERQIGGVEFA